MDSQIVSPETRGDADLDVGPRLDEREFELFRKLIYDQTGIHLKGFKDKMLSSRLIRRLRATGITSFRDYYRLVTNSRLGGEEFSEMINAVTTNKTAFFREASHFDFLKPWLMKLAQGQRRFRFWSAACSAGQEAYTLAMVIEEALYPNTAGYNIRVLGSDINTEVVAKAEAGVYSEAELAGLSLERRRRFLLRGSGENDGFYMVKPSLRNAVSFRQLNLMTSPWPFRGEFDAVFCRNILIYFDEATQRKLVDRLIQTVRPTGLLFLGQSETLTSAHEKVKAVGHAIYRRHEGGSA